MSLNFYTLLNLVTYTAALFGPAIAVSLLPVTAQQGLVLQIIFYIIGAALMIFYHPELKEALVVEEKQKKVSLKKAIGEGFVGIALVTAVQGLANYLDIFISGQLPVSENTQNIMSMIQANMGFILLVSIAGPIMEELFFRRALIGFFGNHFNFWIGAIISSFLFYLAHQDGHFLLYFAMGLTLALLYRSTGRIITSIIAHCGMNTIVILLNLVLTQF